MVYKYYPIKGIKAGLGPGNQVPVRRDINEWSASDDDTDKKQVFLFVLALRELQALPPDSRDSYFQLAGIHGMPYTSWDDPSLTAPEAENKGYCVHANALFPLWHRPYMLLYEQRLYETMLDTVIPKINSEKMRQEYRAAADKWRLPFWDWASHPKMPWLLTQATFDISLNGVSEKIDNPLYKFKMPKGEKMAVYGVGTIDSSDLDGALEYGECTATTRCPTKEQRAATSAAWRDGVVDNDQVNKSLSSHESITDFDYGRTAEMVYRLFTYPLDWKSFATTARDATDMTASASSVMLDMNIEFIHNNIHYWVGGEGGHMSQIPVASFDPVFWLHHCNIDRLFAIWQTLNKDKWFGGADKTRPFDQKVIGMGDVVSAQSPFRPFHKDEEGTLWTADDARDWFQLGYTYPELREQNPDPDLKTKLLRDMTEVYGVSRKEALEMGKPGSTFTGVVETNESGVALNDYAISIRYAKFAMGGQPFSLEVYLRPEGVRENRFLPEEFVTNVYNFSQPAERNGETVCSNCRTLEEQNVQVTAYIPLTSYLIKKIQQQELRNLEPLNVEKFLAGIYYRVAMVGNTVPDDKWKPNMNLNVDVSVTKMDYSKDPSVKPKVDEPKKIPSLGIETGPAPKPGVSIATTTVNAITPLREPVSDGGSVVMTAPSMNLDAPRNAREVVTVISLLHVDASAGASVNDNESYDELLRIAIRPKLQVLHCTSKEAGRGLSDLTELRPEPWFRADNPGIRVDVSSANGGEFEVYVDGRKIGAVKRTVGRGKTVTHARYWTLKASAEPAMGKVLTVTTYQQTGLVP